MLREIKNSLNDESGTLSELFTERLRPALIIGIILALFSQITGINAIIYYAPEIFKSVGFGAESALFQTVLIGAINTLFTICCIVADRQSRKEDIIDLGSWRHDRLFARRGNLFPLQSYRADRG